MRPLIDYSNDDIYAGQIEAVTNLLNAQVSNIYFITSDDGGGDDDESWLLWHYETRHKSATLKSVYGPYKLYESENGDRFVFFYADGGLSVYFYVDRNAEC